MSHKKLFFITILANVIVTILLIIISKKTTLKAVKPKKKKKEKTNLVANIIMDILLVVALVALFGCLFFWRMFPGMVFAQFMFTVTAGGEGANTSFIFDLILSSVGYAMPIFIFFVFVKYFRRDFIFAIPKRKIKINLSKILRIVYKIIVPLLWVAAIVLWSLAVGLPTYLKTFGKVSEVISDNYIPVQFDNITAPDKKRNLIYIFVESLETSAFSEDVGGAGNVNYFPRLTELALGNGVNFSGQNQIGQFDQTHNASWTVASMVSQTSGLPFKLPDEKQGQILTGCEQCQITAIPKNSTIGDVLKDQGYNQTLLIGSGADYGFRDQYFREHGDYQIHDLFWAKENGLITEDYNIGWWGYEDRKLFEFAKDDLMELSAQDQPFNLTMLTVDTHFNDGWLDPQCATTYSDNYPNVLNCADNMLVDFIEWVQEQSFYDDTTIVIAGDHLYMGNFYSNVDQDSRKVFATIINSPVSPSVAKNRSYSHFDLFPTTLASLGFEIKGNRLALGVNLFSDKETLVEHFGIDKLNEELNKNFKLGINEDY